MCITAVNCLYYNVYNVYYSC